MQQEFEEGIVRSPHRCAMRRQQAFSCAVMTLDGSMHAIKGAPPTMTMRAKIPILAILFICLNQLECTHPPPRDASYSKKFGLTAIAALGLDRCRVLLLSNSITIPNDCAAWPSLRR